MWRLKTLALYIKWNSLSEIPAMRFLGVFFDPQLNFKYHVELIISKVSRALFILCTVKNTLTPNAPKSPLIHCHLIYASPIWSICNQQFQNDLFKKQKLAKRAIAGLKYNDHTEPHFKKFEILPIPSLLDFFKFNSCNALCNDFYLLPFMKHGPQMLLGERVRVIFVSEMITIFSYHQQGFLKQIFTLYQIF
jgi:hypothetical protein